jgi:ketosteroid isomerase-like protein
MKHGLILVLCTMGVATVFGGTPKPEVAKAVAAAEQVFVNAVIKRNKPALEELLADDLLYVHSSSKVETKADLLQVVTSGSTLYQSFEFRETTIRQYGDVVITTHKATIKTQQTGTANLFVTHVWAKHKGRWQLASRHASRLPQ